jgi:hypothetical protein
VLWEKLREETAGGAQGCSCFDRWVAGDNDIDVNSSSCRCQA